MVNLIGRVGLLLLLIIAVAYMSYQYGKTEGLATVLADQADSLRPQLNSEDSRFLAAQLGILQAETIKIDAKVEQLLILANLSATEFTVDDRWTKDWTLNQIIAFENKLQRDALQATGQIYEFMDGAGRYLRETDEELDFLAKQLRSQRAQYKALPAGYPLRQGYLSSNFGWRTLNGQTRLHEGIDLAAPSGANIYAVAAGVVVFAGRKGGYGHLVEIKHNEIYSTRYAHNSQNLVSEGEKVQAGQVIALVGSTGRSTGAHLHFELLKYGLPLNPLRYLGTLGTLNLK